MQVQPLTAGVAGAGRRPIAARGPRELSRYVGVLAFALVVLSATGSACGGASRSVARTGVTPSSGSPSGSNAGGPAIARGGSSPGANDEIPTCFVADEPGAPPAGERTDVFQPPARVTPSPAPGASPAPRPTPIVQQIAGMAPFPLYAIAAPVSEYTPTVLRETTAASGGARRVSLFTLQYRISRQRGGGVVIVLSEPSTSAAASPAGPPLRNDIDDAIDAVRMDRRLPGTPQSDDPMADPSTELRMIGCPVHESMTVTIEGTPRPADLETWPGLPRVQLLRVQTGSGEVTLKAGSVSRDALVALAGRLVALQRSPQTAAVLQAVFAGAPVQATPGPEPTPRVSATPARATRTAAPAGH